MSIFEIFIEQNIFNKNKRGVRMKVTIMRLSGLFWGAMALVVIAMQAKGESSTEDWTGKNYQYKSDGFSCEINKAGAMKSLSFKDKVLINQNMIFFDNSDKTIKLLQHDASASSMKITTEGAKTLLTAEGTLNNASDSKSYLDFKQKIILSARQIDFEYEVKTLGELKMTVWRPPFSLCLGKIDCFLERPIEVLGLDGGTSIYGFPKVYVKGKEFCPHRLRELKFVLEDMAFKVRANGEMYSFQIQDARAWDSPSRNFELIIRQNDISSKEETALVPSGTVFKWSFSFFLE
jgi:hypothetical protein